MLAYLAVCFYVFSVPWQNALILPGVGTIARGAALVAFGITALEVLVRARLRPFPPALLLALAFLVWVGLSMSWAIGLPEYISTKFGQYLQLLAMFWAVWEVARTPRRAAGLLLAYVGGCSVATMSTLLNFFSGVTAAKMESRYTVTGFDPNDVGMMLALGIPVAWYLSITATRALIRWGGRLYLPCSAVAIFLTGSRGALLAMIVALTIIPWTMGRIRWNVRVAAVLVVLASAAFAIEYVPAASWQRLASTRTEIETGTLNNRLTIWRAAFQVFPARAIQGFGPAGFHRAVEPVIGFGIAPHNTFLAILMEEGIIGLLIFLALLIAVFMPILTLPVRERRFALVLFATLLTAIMPLGWENRKPLWLILSLLIAYTGMFAVRATSVPRSAPAPATPATPAAAARGRLLTKYGRRTG